MKNKEKSSYSGVFPTTWTHLLHVLMFGFCLLFAVMIISSCGSGGDDSAELNAAETGGIESGAVFIGLTDADGDFLSYTVDVLSLTLTKANGAVIETLPLTTRIDFSQYTEMTEFITAATIPSGIYTKASMVLDYSNADIQVEVDGEALSVVTVNRDGQAIASMEMEVRLSQHKALVIKPGVPAHLTLDFDLDASHEVDVSTDPPVVTVDPLLIADVNPERPKIHRVRGPLKSVDLDGDSFQVLIRPLHFRSGNCGALTVVSNEETLYEIDGQTYTGKDGLKILDNELAGTAVIAMGNLNMAMRQFEAEEVYAGSSVPGGDLDVVRGHVIAREGDMLTLHGATLIRKEGTLVFKNHISILVGSETRVVRQTEPGVEFTEEALSVGQRVTVFGTLQRYEPDRVELDATAGFVRMLMTNLSGNVVAVGEETLIVDIQTIDRRKISLFNFTGTGIDREHDADPQYYEIDTGSLDLSSLMELDPVRVRGFVRPFEQGPADFEARTVMDLSALPARLNIRWQEEGTDAPFESLSPENFVINLDQEHVGDIHHVRRGGIWSDLFDFELSPAIQPRECGEGLYAIAQDGSVVVYTSCENFVEALEERLNGTQVVKHLFASGYFDNEPAELTAWRIAVRVNEAI